VLDNALIRRKLGFLLKHLKELEPLTAISVDEYKADLLKRHAAERIVELIVEYATDINQILLEGLDQPPAQTYYHTFQERRAWGSFPPPSCRVWPRPPGYEIALYIATSP